jgi:hypothetical protein
MDMGLFVYSIIWFILNKNLLIFPVFSDGITAKIKDHLRNNKKSGRNPFFSFLKDRSNYGISSGG